jgi:hypothetical protein
MKAEKLGEARIQASEHWNHTGLRLPLGETYAMSATGTWSDRELEYGPDGGPSRNFFQRLFEWARRRPKKPWFVLTGAVDADERTIFRIGSLLGMYRAGKTGELTCFANDVWVAYGNNSGFVDLTVRRIGKDGSVNPRA